MRRSLTLQIKKDYRKGKVLLDIYRNRQSQTIVAAYSVRGLPGAPVSTPLQWEELESLESPKVFDLHSVPQRVMQNGDPWEAIAAYATPIHTERKETNRTRQEDAQAWRELARRPSNLRVIPRSAALTKHPSRRRQKISGKEVRSLFTGIMLRACITICDWNKTAF